MTATAADEIDKETQICITDYLPNEVLEQILCHLSPYKDFKSAMLVCHQWRRVVQSVIRTSFQTFRRSLTDTSALEWFPGVNEQSPTISERYSHSACYHDKCMYVFGGCTSSQTTFNDLWRLDLAARVWERPMAIGTYPSPKACASLVSHNDRLILFGGWSHPTPYPLHQAARFFNQLHVFVPATDRWTQVQTRPPAPPGKAGHAAAVVRDLMLVFGGSHGHGVSCNELWVLDLVEMQWHKREDIVGNKPLPRYGHSQITLDKDHMLVIGGCGGPNMQFNDVWMLNLDTEPWSWTEIKVLQPENIPPQLWCHPACKVGDKVVVLSKTSRPPKPPPPPPTWIPKKPAPPRSSSLDRPSTSGTAGEAPAAAAGKSTDTAQADDEELEGVVGRVSLGKGQYKRSLPETSESSSQESSSDQDDLPSTSRRHSYRQFKLPNSPPRGSYRGYAWSANKSASSSTSSSSSAPSSSGAAAAAAAASRSRAAAASQGASSDEGGAAGGMDREPSPVSEYHHHRARTRSRSDDVSSRMYRFNAEDEDFDTAYAGSSGSGGLSGSLSLPGPSSLSSISTSGAPANASGLLAAAAMEDRARGGGRAANNLIGEPMFPPRGGAPSVRPNAMKNRQRQLETLKKYEEKLRTNKMSKPSDKPPEKKQHTNSQRNRVQNPMYVHVLDVSRAVSDFTVTWQPIADQPAVGAPEETIFYSLVEGRGEMVMFGGIQTDLNGMQRGHNVNLQFVSNETYYIETPKTMR